MAETSEETQPHHFLPFSPVNYEHQVISTVLQIIKTQNMSKETEFDEIPTSQKPLSRQKQ